MVSWILSRVVVLLFGMLYPAYASYKAVKTKNIREYVRWMMYWIVFALFMAAETITDIFLPWLPFYYELKTAFVLWLLSPYTRGAGLLYRRRSIRALSVRGSRATPRCCTSAGGDSTSPPPLQCTRPPRARALWPGGCAASACRTCAAPPMRPPCTTGTRFTWRRRRRSRAGGHRRVSWGGGGGVMWELCVSPCSVCRVMGLESETDEEEEEEEGWSDAPKAAPHNRDPRPPPRSHSLRAARRKAPSKEGPAWGVRTRVRKKAPPPHQDS